MKKGKKGKSKNDFHDNLITGKSIQIAQGDIYNNTPTPSSPEAEFTAEPIWRSPITTAVLNWIGFFVGIANLFPLYKIGKSLIDFLSEGWRALMGLEDQIITFLVLLVIFVTILSLRKITKNQTRHPLFHNYAINGYGKRLSLEKIHAGRCPKCGGKMRYYNKPVEWKEILKNGQIKKVVTKKVPALECERNENHWYEVDPAKEKLVFRGKR